MTMNTLRIVRRVGSSMLVLVVIGSCSGRAPDDRVYTLYRNSVGVENARNHVATFDADERESYNRENCEAAGQLFQSVPGERTKFWCEKGFYKK